jgi:hypothetical protein
MKTFHLFLAGLAITFMPGPIKASPFGEEYKIVGGREAKEGAYGWEVSLGILLNVPTSKEQRKIQPESSKLDTHFCGGVLIHKDWV